MKGVPLFFSEHGDHWFPTLRLLHQVGAPAPQTSPYQQLPPPPGVSLTWRLSARLAAPRSGQT